MVACCFVACGKDQTSTINPLVKELFCFKTGSTWTYEGTVYDAARDTTRNVILLVNTSSYEESQFEKHCNEKGRGHKFKEYILYKINSKMLMSQTFTSKIIADECGVDNTANVSIVTPLGSALSFYCYADNTFSIDVEYLSTYTYKGHKYEDVYVFTQDNGTYYVSKDVGFVRCEKKYNTSSIAKNNNVNSVTDVWLVDKNVIQ